MKKFILTAVAAGALAVGGAASAQDLGGILGSVLGGFGGTSTYPTYNNGAIPAVVAGAQGGPVYVDQYGRQVDQWGRVVQSNPYGSQVQIDQYGRQVQIDQYGRQVIVQPNSNVYGGGVVYDANGRAMVRDAYGNYTYVNPTNQMGNSGYRAWDRDGDGVANSRDRWPDNPNYR